MPGALVLRPEVFEDASATTPVHKLRRSHAGIQLLKESGRYADYMELPTGKDREFIAWDGEGWTDANLDHHYMLFQCSTGHRIHAPQLTSAECLELILRVGAEKPGAIHVIFGGGYDATHILRDMPTELQYQLKDDEPVEWYIPGKEANYYTINYLPHKWLTVKGFCWSAQKWVRVKIFDIMTFFQSSFIKALKSRDIEVPAEITSGKAGRNTFTYDDLEEISVYCQLELEALVALANQLRHEFQDAGVNVTSWHGPGAVAKASFKQFNIAAHMGEIPQEVRRASQYAYFGGHFEQFKAGHYDGPVYLYDINSAYPHQLRNLPTFEGMEYEPATSYDGHTLGLWLCEYTSDERITNRPNPLPWRSPSGSVGFPASSRGWFWSFEISDAVRPITGFNLRPASGVTPFGYIAEMYETRKQWQAEGRGGEKALKLCMNSGYGSLAQRIGGKGEAPRYHHLSWAGMITSGARRQLWDAISISPETVIAVETDSIMSTIPLDLDIGDGLGQWGLTEHHGVTYIQSGIYFTDDGIGKTKARTRGIDVTQLDETRALEWLKDPSEPLLVMSRNFVGLGNPGVKHLYGQWQESTKEVRVAGQKRLHMPSRCRACADGANMAEALHDLTANPFYGNTMSSPHTLPWVDETTSPDDGYYVGDAVAEFERRHA